MNKPIENATDSVKAELDIANAATAQVADNQASEPEADALNAYEARMQARRERYAERASKAESESQAVHDRAHGMAGAIPFGQPILVGHHSERRDRNYRERIHNTYGKAFALQDKAEHYARKAASVGTGGISSDDPAALQKLRAELESLEHSQEMMKAANKAIRSNPSPEAKTSALVALGFEADVATQLVGQNVTGRIGFPSFRLSNNNANIARIKARIAELEKRRGRAEVTHVGDGFSYREDTSENRVLFVFDSKPDEATRAILKAHAFKWSPSRGAWVRQLSNAGVWNGQEVLRLLERH